VVIVGGGYIANEFGRHLHGFGAHVTIVNRSDTILREYDESVRDRLLQISMAKGIDFRSIRRLKRSRRAGRYN